MSLADKVAGILKKKEVKEVTISFDSVDSYILERISEEEKKITAESADYVEGIEHCRDELSQFLKRLREMEREEMFKRLDKIVRSSQKRFADSLRNVVTRLHLEAETYEELKKVHHDVQDALQQIQKLNKMHGRSLYYAFDREMKPFTKTVKMMAQYNHSLGQLLQSEESVIGQLVEVHEVISATDDMKKEIGEIEKQEKEIGNSMKTLETEIEQLKTEVKTLESSSEYTGVTKMEKQQKNLKKTLKSVEREIYNKLHPLDRDFRKFKRQVELGNFPFDLKLLEDYEKITEQFLKEEEGYPQLKKIAGKMQEALEKQVIKEKGHKRKKIMDILQFILEDGLLPFQREYHSVKAQLEAEPVRSDVVEKIEVVRREIEERKGRISDLKTKREDLILRKEGTKDKIQDSEEEIRDKCGEIGINIE